MAIKMLMTMEINLMIMLSTTRQNDYIDGDDERPPQAMLLMMLPQLLRPMCMMSLVLLIFILMTMMMMMVMMMPQRSNDGIGTFTNTRYTQKRILMMKV